MGWTNSHLYRFEINGERYGDPELLYDGCEDFECVDSTKSNLSDILPKTRKRFAFKYDFGDGWEHDVLFVNGARKVQHLAGPMVGRKVQRPPCPPEDCGGILGLR